MANNQLNTKVPVVPPMGRVTIERKTTAFLGANFSKAITEASPVDIEYLFELLLPKYIKGLRTGYFDLSFLGPGVMGYTSANKKVCLVDKLLFDLATRLDAKKSDIRRFRATVSHEVSHAICHYPYLNFFESFNVNAGSIGLMRIEKRKDIPAYKDPEWQAWEMAGSLLMPKTRVIQDINLGRDKYEIADIYNVNPAFAQQRIDSIRKQQ